MRTVRARITALATLVGALVLGVAAVALVAVLEGQLTEQSDGGLRARAAGLADAAATGTLDPQQAPVTDDGLVQVVAADGRVLAASANVSGEPAIAPSYQRDTELRVETLEAPDDGEVERYRMWSLGRDTPDGVVTVYVGTGQESVKEATGTLRTSLLVGVPLMLALLALGTWYVVGRALARVERVRLAVSVIDDRDLSSRLEAGPPDEVGRLVGTLNAMLDRLEDNQLRQRSFIADASHELQSPVTAFRTQLEVARAHPVGTAWPRLVEDLLEDTDRMQSLLADLLLLAAADAATPPTESFDLRDVVAIETERAGSGRIPVALADATPVVVVADRCAVGRAVRNLLENAVQHASTTVEVSIDLTATTVVVLVSDDGPGVPHDHVERIFDRFHHLDRARAPGRSGTGLGLAIARSVARSHGGDVVLTGPGPGAVFELRLPRG